MIIVGKNTRSILENMTPEQIQSMVPEEWMMRILEEGGVTTDFRSVWLLVYWGSCLFVFSSVALERTLP